MFTNEMIIRTKRAVVTSLDNLSEKSKLVFRYRIEIKRTTEIYVKVDVYSEVAEGEYSMLKGVYKMIEGEQLLELMSQAEKNTPAVPKETPLEYFQRLIGNGIKIYIVSQNLWQSLTMGDFE